MSPGRWASTSSAARLQRQLRQKEAARLLGVTSWTVFNWEKGRTDPSIEAMPALLSFLGYDPLPEPQVLPERLLAKRRAMGFGQSGREPDSLAWTQGPGEIGSRVG